MYKNYKKYQSVDNGNVTLMIRCDMYTGLIYIDGGRCIHLRFGIVRIIIATYLYTKNLRVGKTI